MFKGKTIFISPLDWGLGHATRCVPIIRSLEKNNKIIIGTTPLTAAVFKEEFPLTPQIKVPAYNIKYSSVLPLWLKLLLQWPHVNSTIKKENKLLNELIDREKIDVVISDNRFGLFSKKIHSVFITHQLFLKAPFATPLVQEQNRKHLWNFNEIWIPDYEDEKISLAGELSHGESFLKNVKYIGPQSRLQKIATETKYDYLFLVSGPQPQQKIFMGQCIELARKNPASKCAIVTPVTPVTPNGLPDVFVNPAATELSQLICSSKKIICRSGYSTLMDLYLLGKKEIILVPTPGQTEQEYLAKLWSEKFRASVINQKHLSINTLKK